MTSQRPPTAKGQRDVILARLVAARGAWVPLPELMKLAAQYNARIFDLRKLGLTIENKTETIDGVRHSWFRLVTGPPTTKAAPAVSNASGTQPVLFEMPSATADECSTSERRRQRRRA